MSHIEIVRRLCAKYYNDVADLRDRAAAGDLVSLLEVKNFGYHIVEQSIGLVQTGDPELASTSPVLSVNPHNYIHSGFHDDLSRRIRLLISNTGIGGAGGVLLASAPPQHGKTELAKAAICSELGRVKNRPIDVMMIMYNDTVTSSHGSDVRSWVTSDWFAATFPEVEVTIASVGHVQTRNRVTGVYANARFVPIGGTISGLPATFIIVDDLFKNTSESRSPQIREQVRASLASAVMPRMRSGTSLLQISTRWGVGDAWDVLSEGVGGVEGLSFSTVNYPAISGDDDVIGRAPGELLVPQLKGWPIINMARNVDPIEFELLYQGCPAPEGGMLFKAEYIKRKDPPPLEHMRIYAGTDHAIATGNKNDYTAITVIGVTPDYDMHVLYVWRGKVPGAEQVNKMFEVHERFGVDEWFVEKTHVSQTIAPLIEQRRREARKPMNYRMVTPKNDKMMRSAVFEARMRAGKVYFPLSGASWYADFISELLTFPTARHDDMVDAASHVFREIAHLYAGNVPKEHTVESRTPYTVDDDGVYHLPIPRVQKTEKKKEAPSWGFSELTNQRKTSSV